MNKLIILVSTLLFIAACSITERVEYIDREVLIPDIKIESCITEIVKKKCDKEIITYRDLAECYLILQDRIDRINNIIEQCNN